MEIREATAPPLRGLGEDPAEQAALLAQVPAAVVCVDPAGTVKYWNEYSRRLLQWGAAEALGRTFADLAVPDDERARLAELWGPTPAADVPAARGFTLRRRDGSPFTAILAARRLIDAHGEAIGSAIVITETRSSADQESEAGRHPDPTSSAGGATKQNWLLEALGDLGVGAAGESDAEHEEETLAEVNAVAATLAEVSEQIIASLRSPGFLDHLCRLTAEALDCEQSHTLLLRPNDDVFEVIAGSGESPEEREAGRIVRVPRVQMAVLLERLEHDEVAAVRSIPSAYSQQRPDLATGQRLCLALRNGGQVIGIQTAARIGRGGDFTPAQILVARGIARLASLALDHARLVEELERASRVRSDFVATMSHELRTPLHHTSEWKAAGFASPGWRARNSP